MPASRRRGGRKSRYWLPLPEMRGRGRGYGTGMGCPPSIDDCSTLPNIFMRLSYSSPRPTNQACSKRVRAVAPHSLCIITKHSHSERRHPSWPGKLGSFDCNAQHKTPVICDRNCAYLSLSLSLSLSRLQRIPPHIIFSGRYLISFLDFDRRDARFPSRAPLGQSRP